MNPKNIAIIGGGASGLMAACHAAMSKAKVVVFEKQKRTARKLMVTGNGRCNISNSNISIDRYHGHNPRFVNNVFGKFGLQDTIDFFQEIGLPMVELEEGRLYPVSLRASSVAEILEYETKKRGAEIHLHRQVDAIEKSADQFILTTAGRERFPFDRVILATGSCAYPQLGGSHAGYELAKSLGHSIHEPFPSILPLGIPFKALHKLQGIKYQAAVKVVENGKLKQAAQGELLFTGYGLSGPAALDISRCVNEMVIRGDIPDIVIDLYPEYGENELMAMVDNAWNDGEKTIAFSLSGIMHKKTAEVLAEMAGLDPHDKVKNCSNTQKNGLASLMKNLRIAPGPPRTFREAVVAAGGVDVNEINGGTMESRIVSGCYITGELLDIDGDSGGFNLQFAWSTGALAGMAAR